MSRVEKLANSISIPATIFLKFTRINSKGLIVIFFEGEDEKYYSVRINTTRPDIKWASIICEGKNNVIKARDNIREHSEYKNAVCLFFVDADFDDNTTLLSYDDTYVSSCYSIENLYVSDNSFKRILSAEFKISEYGDEKESFEKATFAYQHCKASYLENISHFNYWIRTYRLMQKEGLVQEPLNINNINFENLITVDLFGTQKIYDANNIVNLFRNFNKNINLDISESIEYFNNHNKELWFRGKQHIGFFRIFINLLIDDRCKKSDRKIFAEKGNVKLAKLSKENVISELSQYADTPTCLINFLKNNWGQSKIFPKK